MQLFASMTIVLLLVLSPIAAAQEDFTPSLDDTYERYRIPEGRRCAVDGVTFACFTVEEYTVMLEMDVDLRFYDTAYPLVQAQVVNLGNVASQLRLAVDAAAVQIDILQVERARLLTQWSEENRLRLEAENQPLLGEPLAWIIAAAEAVVIAILVGVMAASGL